MYKIERRIRIWIWKKAMPKKIYDKGKHPNSLANLTYHEGRPKLFDEGKKRRNLSVTEKGWNGLKSVADELGCSSVSDFLEKLGRGEVKVKVSA
jgi:hypothetical protein